MDLEDIILSEIEKEKCHMISYICTLHLYVKYRKQTGGCYSRVGGGWVKQMKGEKNRMFVILDILDDFYMRVYKCQNSLSSTLRFVDFID